ncbi:MAG: hypothetical protein QNJ31_02315 [Candidatus Caenarcaniphilales bacterium]|nr:hypothetical protein [Candidatus Caenarcaniphilales bacterium]
MVGNVSNFNNQAFQGVNFLQPGQNSAQNGIGTQTNSSNNNSGTRSSLSGSGTNSDIAQIAESKVGEQTSNIAGTNGGRLACAAVVSNVLSEAGVLSGNEKTLSCDQLERKLKDKGARESGKQEGAIAFVGGGGGSSAHVGVVGEDGKVIANSSSQRQVTTGWNPESDSRGNVRYLSLA